mgnify:CR=1 FL=1
MSDTLGNIKVKPIYKEIKNFIIDYENDFASRYVVKSNKTYYVIDQNKKVLLPELNTYDSIYLNKNYPNHFWVFKKGKVGLYHKNKEIIGCFYDKITVLANESYEVQNGKLSGLINSLGKLIIPIEYVRIRPSWDEEDEKNPKFVFDINAFARASLGIGWFSISETWRYNLASFSWGPDIQFGLVFPIHYQEGEPFDISFDDLEVIYPEIDVVDTAKSLASDIKDDLFD